MRASDADRDVTLDVLRDAFADGRLARAEYDERADTALHVRTLGEVMSLIGDLVPTGARPALRPSGDVREEAVQKYRRDLRDARNGWIFVSGVTVAVWVATSIAGSGPYFFWPVFPILGVGVGWFSTRMNSESRIEDHEKKLTDQRRRRREIDE